MYLKKLSNPYHSVAFRLTIWYAGIFSLFLIGTLLAFYMLVLHGAHGISHHALRELREAFRHYFVRPLAIVILLSTVVGWFMARRALSGVDEVARTAMAISNGALHRRVPVRGSRNEVDRLAETFNTMVDRVEALINQMKEITENIAHDLRSPISRMRGVAEMALAGRDSADEYATMAGTIVEECDRLLGMINTMLDISEAEAGLAKLDVQQIDLAAVVRDVCELFQPLAEDRGIVMTIGGPQELSISGDLRKLQRVFSNLIDNAIKYTPTGGRVTVTLSLNKERAFVTIEDTGAGIPESDLPHVFDRFFRGERSRTEPGNGLGLSLAQAFVVIHGGEITVSSGQDGGSRFMVSFPRIAISPA